MSKNQFVKTPKFQNLKSLGLKLKDLVVYAYLRRYYNETKRNSYPSLLTLAEDTGLAVNTVNKSIDRLEKADYIKVFKTKSVNRYTFSDLNKFEIFSFEFLDDDSLTIDEKGILIAEQSLMFKNKDLGIGKIAYTDLELAATIGIDVRTLMKHERGLQLRAQPILTVVPTSKIDPDTGLSINERVFDLDAYHNLLAVKFKQIDDKIENVNKQTEENTKDIQMLFRRISQLEQEQHIENAKAIVL